MDRGDRDRGVSEVIGFVLVFGMLVTAFTVYQGIVVPDQNRQVEFQHNQEVQGDLQDLRNAIVTTASTGSGQGVSVTLGATYPTRTIATNLGLSGGAISTMEVESPGIRIDNVRALDVETRDYVDSSANGPLGPFESKSIRYTPVYTFYSGAPETVYENTIAYNQFDGVNVTLTDQIVVDDRRITLIAVNGSLSDAQRDTVSIGTEAISTSSNRVGVENTTGEQVTLTIPTTLVASEWEAMLVDELVSNGGYVEDVVDVPDEAAVTVVMKQAVTYELRMAKVGVGELTSDEPATYVTDVEGDDVSVSEDGTRKLVAEVRDRFNNPVSNVTVTAGSPSLGSVSPASATTDSDGRATFVYKAPADVNDTRDVDVNVSFDGDGSERESVTFDVRVLDSDGSGSTGGSGEAGGSINPGGSNSLVLAESTIDGGGCGLNCVRVSLENLDTSNAKSVDEMRFVFYSVDSQGGSGFTLPASAKVDDDDSLLLVKGGDYDDDVSITVAPGSQESFELHFYENADGTAPFDGPGEGDFFVVAVLIDDGSSSATYFVAPTA